MWPEEEKNQLPPNKTNNNQAFLSIKLLKRISHSENHCPTQAKTVKSPVHYRRPKGSGLFRLAITSTDLMWHAEFIGDRRYANNTALSP